MLDIDKLVSANRPLIFITAENDLEVLKHLDAKYNDRYFFVYSSTLASIMPLKDLLKGMFNYELLKALSTHEVLQNILHQEFKEDNQYFYTYVFLDSQTYVNGVDNQQIVRDIKDILTRYQLDEKFTVNLIFISQTIGVPMQLERLSEVAVFDLPNDIILRETSDKLIKRLELSSFAKNNKDNIEEILNNLKGLTAFEVEQAYLQSHRLFKMGDLENPIDIKFIRDFKKNAIAKTDLLSLSESTITFRDIGGMDKLKEWIIKSYGGWTVEGKKFGLPLMKGLLLVGLPGCGKSLIMKAIGNAWGLLIVNFDPSRVFSSGVGDSESNIRRVLQIVENMSPCILSIDEIEKGFAGMQSSTFSDSGVTARVIGSFLTWMQECSKPVFIIATANNIQQLPPEMISRFDETFFVSLPMDFERLDIFKIHIEKLGRDPTKFDLKKLAEKSIDLSGREIEQAIREAMYDAFAKAVDINTDIILDVLSKKTNLLTTMAEQLKFLRTWVGWDEVKGDGVRARFASTPSNIEIKRVDKEIEDLISGVEGKIE